MATEPDDGDRLLAAVIADPGDDAAAADGLRWLVEKRRTPFHYQRHYWVFYYGTSDNSDNDRDALAPESLIDAMQNLCGLFAPFRPSLAFSHFLTTWVLATPAQRQEWWQWQPQ